MSRELRPGERPDQERGRRYVELHVMLEITQPQRLIQLAQGYYIASCGYDALDRCETEDELLEKAVWLTTFVCAPHMARREDFPMADMLHLVYAFPAGEDEETIERTFARRL